MGTAQSKVRGPETESQGHMSEREKEMWEMVVGLGLNPRKKPSLCVCSF